MNEKEWKLRGNSVSATLRTNKYYIWCQLNTNVLCLIRTVLILSGREGGTLYVCDSSGQASETCGVSKNTDASFST